MQRRSFRAFAEKEDLKAVFGEYQKIMDIYYVTAFSKEGEVSFDDVTCLEDLGVNFYGSHNGNKQILALPKGVECLWNDWGKAANIENGKYAAQDMNIESIVIDLNGVYEDTALFPTEVSTLHYDNETSKNLFDELRKIFRRQAFGTAGGYYILCKAYEDKDKYRFCTIDIKSPPEYDLTF